MSILETLNIDIDCADICYEHIWILVTWNILVIVQVYTLISSIMETMKKEIDEPDICYVHIQILIT